MTNERNKKILLELVKQPENSRCADCGAPEPDWASYKIGVFVCLNCSGIHRSLSSRVKSIRLDFWEDDLVEFMKSTGNANARAVYEKAVPPYYYRPLENDCNVLRDQWIRAKYQRMEFNGVTKYPPLAYTTGFHEGILWKKGKENMQFQKRKFVLSEREFTLSYYNKEDESKGPKAVISIKDLNATFQPQKISHPHGLQITYQDENKTRNLYVYHESAEVKLHGNSYLVQLHPCCSLCIPEDRIPDWKRRGPCANDNKKLPKRGVHGKDGALAEGVFQKALVYFGLTKQEAALLQRPTGCRGVRGHFHRDREQRLLREGVCPEARAGQQVEVRHHGGDAGAPVCVHVRAGEGAEAVAERPEKGAVQAHVTTRLHCPSPYKA